MPVYRSILPVHAGPLLLGLLIGLLIALITWGSLRARRSTADSIETQDNVLVGMLVLAAISFGVFLSYVLLGISP